MPSTLEQLTPPQLAVYEVFRRLEAAHLPPPTTDTLAQLTRLKTPTVVLACEQLVESGRLVRGGATKRSFRLPSPHDAANTNQPAAA